MRRYKYQIKGMAQDNTSVRPITPFEVERANYLNRRDEFGRAYPTQQNPGTISAPVSLDPNMGFVRHAGEAPAMSRYKGDAFKREVQGGFAGAGLGAASHYAGRGLKALRGASKMKPAVFKPARPFQETNPGPAPYKYEPVKPYQETNLPHIEPEIYNPPNIMQEFDVPRTPTTFKPVRPFQEINRPGPPNIMQETDKVFKSTPSGPPKIMQEADRAFIPQRRPGPANVKPEFDVPRASRAKPGPAQVTPEDDTFKMAAEIFNEGPGTPGYSSLSRGQMTASEFAKAFEALKKKKFKHGGAARRYMRY